VTRASGEAPPDPFADDNEVAVTVHFVDQSGHESAVEITEGGEHRWLPST
jgi:hypothetical protein